MRGLTPQIVICDQANCKEEIMVHMVHYDGTVSPNIYCTKSKLYRCFKCKVKVQIANTCVHKALYHLLKQNIICT